MSDKRILVGAIAAAHGVRGEVKIKSFTEVARDVGAYGPVEDESGQRRFKLKLRGEAKGLVIAALEGVGDRNAAEALRGARVFIARSSFPTAGDGEFYWIDLIGLAVVNRQGEALGEVIGLLDTGAHSVLRLRRPAAEAAMADDSPSDSSERLIPFVGAFIDDVNLADKRITVDWGLDY